MNCRDRIWNITPAIFGYFTLLALHVWLARRMTLPQLLYDEFGYFATGAYFAGFDWSNLASNNVYYSFGYGLLLAPVLRWVRDPYAVYQGALCLNAAFISAVFPIAWSMARTLAPSTPASMTLLAAAAVSVYPSYVVLACFAWPESLYTALCWAISFGFFHATSSRRPLCVATILGLGLGLLYVVHQRGIALAAAGLLVFLVLCATQNITARALVTFCVALAATLTVAFAVKSHVLTAVWLDSELALRLDPASAVIRDVTPHQWTAPFHLDRLVRVAIGQAFYLSAASLMLALAGIITALSWLSGRPHARPLDPSDTAVTTARARRAGALYLIIATGASFATSITFHRLYERGDQLLYGRYTEGVFGPLVLVGLLTVAARDAVFRQHRRAAFYGATAGFALLGVAALGLLRAEVAVGSNIWFNITGFIPYFVPGPGWLVPDLQRAALQSAVLGISVLAASHCIPRLSLAVVGVFFLWAGVTGVGYLAGEAQKAAASAEVAVWLRSRNVTVPIHFLLSDAKADLVRRRLQFVLPDNAIQEVNSPHELADEHAAVVITKRADLDQTLPRMRLVGEFPGPLRLWTIGSVAGLDDLTPPARPGPTPRYRFKLVDEGAHQAMLIPWGNPLRRWLYKEQFAWVPWGSRSVKVRVRHEDAYLWPPELRLGLVWERAERRGIPVAEYRIYELPRMPGQSKQVELPIRPYRDNGQPLDPGRYVLTVGLVEEGVRWLSDAGGPTLSYSIVLAE